MASRIKSATTLSDAQRSHRRLLTATPELSKRLDLYRTTRAEQETSDRAHQFLRCHGLIKDFRHSQTAAQLLEGAVIAKEYGQENDLGARVVDSHFCDEIHAGPIGQQPIDNDKVGRFLLDDTAGLSHATGFQDTVATVLQGIRQKKTGGAVVLENEDRGPM